MNLFTKNPENTNSMNSHLYRTVPLVKPGFLQQLLKQQPEENAVIELNNLFATKPLREITPRHIEAIQHNYKLNLLKEFRLNLEEFYAVYLNHCLADKVLSNEELEELKHLKLLLQLDEATINKLHAKLGALIYRQSFEEAVSDGRLSQKERDLLQRIENDLKLPRQLADQIAAEVKTGFIEKQVAHIISDQRLSPKEEEELQAIAGSLNVSLQFNEQTKAQLEKLKRYWALENLDLPVIQPGIVLQKSEQCYLEIPQVNWHELRSVRQKAGAVQYAPGAGITKEFYLRPGNRTLQSQSNLQLTLIDTGTLYLTSKRVIFNGVKKNATIQLAKIIDLTPYSDGVEIDKETGKSPTLQMPEKADVFCILLERLLIER
jgi:hypothetical protein